MEDKIIRLTGKTLKAKNKLRNVANMDFAKRITQRKFEVVWMVLKYQHAVPFSVEDGPWLFVQPVVHIDELLDKRSSAFMAESEISARWVHLSRDRDFVVEVLEKSPYVGDCKHTYRYRNLPCSVSKEPWYVQGRDVFGGVGVLEWCRDELDAKERLSVMSIFPQFTELSIGKHAGGPGMNPLIANDLEALVGVNKQNSL